jgi:hypothetical protein
MGQLSNPRQVFLLGMPDHAEEMVGSADILEAQAAPAAAYLPACHLVGDHLEAEAKEELSFGHLQVSEIQDETQEDAATSSPDPLTLDGPEDRDIDVSQPLPDSAAGSSGAYIRNQLGASRGFLATVFPEAVLVLTFSILPFQQNWGFRATSDLGVLVQPERMYVVGLPMWRPSS